jgi:hypothetical protein
MSLQVHLCHQGFFLEINYTSSEKVSFIHEFGIGILELTSQKHHGLCGVLIVFFQMAQMLQLLKCSG